MISRINLNAFDLKQGLKKSSERFLTEILTNYPLKFNVTGTQQEENI